MSYQPNRSNVVHDTIDGEVLAIRSDTGAYYSMTGPAATSWCAVISGRPIDELAEVVAAHHGTDVTTVASSLTEFADRLIEESLLIRAEGDSDSDSDEAVDLPAETAGTPWSAPTYEKYTDMEDLLLFDPIHEVQPSGWPNAAPSGP